MTPTEHANAKLDNIKINESSTGAERPGKKVSDFLLWWKFSYIRSSGLCTLIALIAYQLSYSVAPVFLSRAITSETRDDTLYFVILYVALNFIPYPITFFLNQCEIRWIVDAKRAVYEKIAAAFRGKTWLVGSSRHEKKYVALVTGNSQSIVESSIEYLYATVSAIASSVATLMVVSVFADATLSIAYLVSLVSISFVILKSRSKQRRFSCLRERSSNLLYGLLGSLSTSISLDQPLFSKALNRKTIGRWKNFRVASIRSTAYFQKISLIQACLIWAPMTCSIIWVISTRPHELVIAFLPFLPRIIELLLDMSNLGMRLVGWGAQTGKLRWFAEQINTGDGERVFAQIRLHEISVHDDGRPEGDLKTLGGIAYLRSVASEPGLTTLQGANGAGKSVLLRQLKYLIGAKSILVCANEIQSDQTRPMSTGQNKAREVKAAFDYAEENPGTVLLLDEWNANLDGPSEAHARVKINALRSKVRIIETIHHR